MPLEVCGIPFCEYDNKDGDLLGRDHGIGYSTLAGRQELQYTDTTNPRDQLLGIHVAGEYWSRFEGRDHRDTRHWDLQQWHWV